MTVRGISLADRLTGDEVGKDVVVVVLVEVLSGRREECGEELESPCTVALFPVELATRACTSVPRSLVVGAASVSCGGVRVVNTATRGEAELDEV